MIRTGSHMNINLHIEKLVLDDTVLQSHARGELKAAVAAELKRRLASQGIGTIKHSSTVIPTIRAASISVDNSTKPAGLGHKIGNAVYKSIQK